MNYARMKKADLVSLAHNNEASLEMRSVVIRQQQAELVALRIECAELRAQLQPLVEAVATAKLIANRGELMTRMRDLSREGVPCHMQGDFIRHSRTGAVLAQVGQPYPLRG